MFMTDINNVKIYNLSAGKSIPEWLTDRKKKNQLKRKLDSRRQIELIQDFDMPGVSTSIRMSPDMEYIIATGTYKPRVKCYEVCNLSIKFERCFDSEVTCFEILSDDYSKMVFLQCDRYIEFHTSQGRHYRLRIPKFGRDMKLHKQTADLLIGATSSDIYRLNLERGQFLQSYESEGSCINAIAVNDETGLICVGTEEGTVEAWDYRDRKKIATLDVAINLIDAKEFPSISTMNFKNSLTLGVGTKSGHVLVYDIRSKTPKTVKDHLNRLPIKRINFNENLGNVYSMDAAMLKIWDETSAKQVCYIEANTHFNDFCTIPNTGMFFLAQEDVKMLTYYVPAMGPAPKWCSFLDNIAEEIESEVVENIYDDYKFVTTKELEELGLDNLIGTNLLRAYMHGYFIDFRLYQKAKMITEPTSYESYKANKIRKEIEAQRPSRLQMSSDLPKINQELALKIIDESQNSSKKSKKLPNLLEDNRFKKLFENADFKIDTNAAEYKMLAPVINRLKKTKTKEIKKRIESARVLELQADEEEHKERESDNDDDLFGMTTNNKSESSSDEQESSDDEQVKEFGKEMKQAYKDVKKDRAQEDDDDDDEEEVEETGPINSLSKMVDISAAGDFKVGAPKKNSKISFERLLQKKSYKGEVDMVSSRFGNKQMSFSTKKVTKDMRKREYEMKKHREERKRLVRPINHLKLAKTNFK